MSTRPALNAKALLAFVGRGCRNAVKCASESQLIALEAAPASEGAGGGLAILGFGV